MLFLDADTSVTVRCGPFVSPTDGYTAVTGAAPTVYISKNHGAFAARNGTTWTHDRDGWYSCQLSATDTDTEGPLMLEVAGASTYLPVFMEFHVLPAQVFDSLITGTDLLDTNASQVGGTAQTGRDLGASVLLSPGTGTGQISLTSGAVTVGTNNDKTGYTASTVSDKTGYSLADATSDAVIADAVWNAATSGYGAGGSYGEKVEGFPSMTAIENAVWDASRGDHLTAGTFGQGVASVQGNVTGSVASVTAAVTVGTISAGAIDAAAIATGAIDADALAADAGTEIADAVLDRSITEPTGVFTWPATLRNIIRWIGALSRNKLTQTSSTQTLRNDADNADISTSGVTDNAGTTTRGEWT